jgi:hypothetical protein
MARLRSARCSSDSVAAEDLTVLRRVAKRLSASVAALPAAHLRVGRRAPAALARRRTAGLARVDLARTDFLAMARLEWVRDEVGVGIAQWITFRRKKFRPSR